MLRTCSLIILGCSVVAAQEPQKVFVSPQEQTVAPQLGPLGPLLQSLAEAATQAESAVPDFCSSIRRQCEEETCFGKGAAVNDCEGTAEQYQSTCFCDTREQSSVAIVTEDNDDVLIVELDSSPFRTVMPSFFSFGGPANDDQAVTDNRIVPFRMFTNLDPTPLLFSLMANDEMRSLPRLVDLERAGAPQPRQFLGRRQPPAERASYSVNFFQSDSDSDTWCFICARNAAAAKEMEESETDADLIQKVQEGDATFQFVGPQQVRDFDAFEEMQALPVASEAADEAQAPSVAASQTEPEEPEVLVTEEDVFVVEDHQCIFFTMMVSALFLMAAMACCCRLRACLQRSSEQCCAEAVVKLNNVETCEAKPFVRDVTVVDALQPCELQSLLVEDEKEEEAAAPQAYVLVAEAGDSYRPPSLSNGQAHLSGL